MNSNQIKAAFSAAGIKVRVATQLRSRFRVCTLDGSAHTAASQAVLAALGCTNAAGILGGNVNQPHEIFTTAPGIVRRFPA